jgi:hypothetical protein
VSSGLRSIGTIAEQLKEAEAEIEALRRRAAVVYVVALIVAAVVCGVAGGGAAGAGDAIG